MSLDDVRLVLITDRRLMGGASGFGDAIAAAVRDLPPGRAIVQVREKDLDGGALLALVRVAQAAAPAQLVMVNDRLDVALAAGAAGLHVPEDGLDLAAACAVGPSLFIGCSRHDPPSVVAAERDGADLVQLGPIWATPSKAAHGEPLGTNALVRARAGLGDRRLLVAVGGIDSLERAALARKAGADAIAVIRAVWTAADPGAMTRALL